MAEPHGTAGGPSAFRLMGRRILRLQGRPEEVAGGVAIGIFVGMTPTVPLHTVLAVAIAFLLKKNKIAAALGVWVANPFVLPFIYLLDYRIGRLLTGADFPSLGGSTIHRLLGLGLEFSLPAMIGGMVLGLISALPAYFLLKRVLVIHRAKKRASPIEPAAKAT